MDSYMEPNLRQIKNRRHMIRFFDGYTFERMEELDERKLKRPLVKSHLLEVLDGAEARTTEGLQNLFRRRDVLLKSIDEDLFIVTDLHLGDIGFLERLRPRVVALYSAMKSPEPDRWVERLVQKSPEFDHVWLSGITFSVLWQIVARLSRPNRYTRLTFTHESIFDIDNSIPDLKQELEDVEATDTLQEDDSEDIVERRRTVFQLKDRIGIIQEKLEHLQEIYSPLYAISQLRFPSPIGRGGHDFYDNGKVTNKSDSFPDHRNHLLFIVKIYERLLKLTEQQAWYSIQESMGVPGEFRKIVGAPVVIRFREALNPIVFDQWITATFERKRNRFRLWGHPIRLGPTKVHVYGVDRHLWQPLFLELTAKGCIAIIPNGTCGNTVHRLVTNIQRYLDPGAEAFIGDKPYKQMVEESAQGILYDPNS
jgi:hypothetical protein